MITPRIATTRKPIEHAGECSVRYCPVDHGTLHRIDLGYLVFSLCGYHARLLREHLPSINEVV